MRFAAVAFAVVLVLGARLPGQTPGERPAGDVGRGGQVEFNRDIRPLLSDKCFTCHGPDQARRRTKLRFDVESDAKQDLGGRFAIVPGDVAKSEMIRRITAADPARRMPPAASGRTLTDREIELIQTMDRAGRQMGEPLVLHRAAAPAPSRGQETGRGRENEIDAFVLASARAGRLRALRQRPIAPH